MTRPALMFDAYKDERGNYTCDSVSEIPETETEIPGNRYAAVESPVIEPPQWLLDADQLFRQSLQSNYSGDYSEYFVQMQDQFARMHELLQQQMAQYTGNH
ncbi:hypothetical protein [Gynuella sunshinyii]|uniref:Uncharacterized protein n=1 Tax=Gynuella sunshinyii YC6258 TaxID=1445510 RepID=A0A0C5VX01_9GAMM|nr:hypothetical protein [Gynuella sunshinyii]AJQ97833.1 hypothetical Protein YC6258_05805 [Gynuella sunshinyii YC6258]